MYRIFQNLGKSPSSFNIRISCSRSRRQVCYNCPSQKHCNHSNHNYNPYFSRKYTARIIWFGRWYQEDDSTYKNINQFTRCHPHSDNSQKCIIFPRHPLLLINQVHCITDEKKTECVYRTVIRIRRCNLQTHRKQRNHRHYHLSPWHKTNCPENT